MTKRNVFDFAALCDIGYELFQEGFVNLVWADASLVRVMNETRQRILHAFRRKSVV